jgi:hypothetical protein
MPVAKSRSTLIKVLMGSLVGGVLLLFFFPAGIRPVFVASAVVVLLPVQAAIAYSLAIVRKRNPPSGSDSTRRFPHSPTSYRPTLRERLQDWMAGITELRAPLWLDESYSIVTGSVIGWFVVALAAVLEFQFGSQTGTIDVILALLAALAWTITVLYLLVRIASGLHSCFAERFAGPDLRNVLERLATVAFLAAAAMPVPYCLYRADHIKMGLSGIAARYCLPPRSIEQATDIGGVSLKGKLLILDEYEEAEGKAARSPDVSSWQIYLPTPIRAETPDEVRAVAIMTERREVVGVYNEVHGWADDRNGTPATRVDCAVRLLTEPEHNQVWEGEFRGLDPSSSLDSGQSGRGTTGCYDAIRLLSGMHRQ